MNALKNLRMPPIKQIAQLVRLYTKASRKLNFYYMNINQIQFQLPHILIVIIM